MRYGKAVFIATAAPVRTRRSKTQGMQTLRSAYPDIFYNTLAPFPVTTT